MSKSNACSPEHTWTTYFRALYKTASISEYFLRVTGLFPYDHLPVTPASNFAIPVFGMRDVRASSVTSKSSKVRKGAQGRFAGWGTKGAALSPAREFPMSGMINDVWFALFGWGINLINASGKWGPYCTIASWSSRKGCSSSISRNFINTNDSNLDREI